jgi:hypothetical protein
MQARKLVNALPAREERHHIKKEAYKPRTKKQGKE